MDYLRCVVLAAVRLIVVASAGAAMLVPAWAEDAQTSPLKISGFLSLVDGRVLGSHLDPNNYTGPASVVGMNAPFYTADWSNGGAYGADYSINAESHAGVQLSYALTDQAHLVGQVVVRGTDGTPDVTWAYASVKLSKSWEVQVGRKRIPLYYYSDFQDIGVAYPWVSPPPELYGWDATNYNGASLRYSTSVGASNLATSVFGGREVVNRSRYNLLLVPGDTQVSWDNLVGADVEVNNGALTVRGVYAKANTRTVNESMGSDYSAALSAYGVAFNLDFDRWFVLSEVTQLQRDYAVGVSIATPYSVKAPAFTVGAGLRLGAWTPFLNVARYEEQSSDTTVYTPQTYQRTSLTVRYDLNASSAIKAQLDSHKDVTTNFGGDVTVFRLSYDRVF
jgi:hypothetical protein